MNRREGLREEGAAFLRNYRTGDPKVELAKVRAPTLIVWGMGNITVAHLEADVFQLWLTQAPSIKKKYPRYGHYIYMENPAIVIPDVRNFLEGRMDADLRVTRRMPSGS
jgi:pimeloyl-ACP methyl ester carboxylesterase